MLLFGLMRAITLAIVMLLGAASTQAQTLAGRVTDASQEPIVGAYLTNGVTTVATDVDGQYTLTLKPGEHTIWCTFIGMTKQEFKATLTEGQTVEWNPVMASAAEELGLVVVSAGRFEQNASEVTVSLEVLKPALVENKATTSLETAIEQTPGVSLVDGEPQIRSGSGFSYGAGSRVMVMVDDLPVLSGDAGRPTWSFLPLENLEQIEVIKGASSVLYGSAALSGVINIRTRYPDARPLTRISLQHGWYSDPQSADSLGSKYWEGTLQQSNVRFLHSQQLGGWDVVIGGNLLGDDGYKGPEVYSDSVAGEWIPVDTASMAFNPFDVNRYGANSQARVNVNIRRRETKVEGLTFGLNTNWQQGESVNTLIWERAYDGLYGSTDGAATRTKQLVGTVDPYVEYISSSGTRHSLRNRWQHLNNDNDNGQGNASDVFYSEYQVQQRGEPWGVPGLILTGGAVHQLTLGRAELYSGGNPNGVNTARNVSAYAQADQKVGERLNLSLGGRYEHFSINDSTASKPVFRAGLNFQPAEATWLRTSFGQGFRFPTIAEKFIRTGVGPLQVYPSNDLRPETAINVEAGIKQGLQIGAFQGFIDAAAFFQAYENFIEFTFGQWDPNGGVDELYGFGFRSLNTGSSQVTGWETSLMGRFVWGETTLNLLTGYTYTNPISTTPDYAYHVAEAGNSTTGITYNTTSFNVESVPLDEGVNLFNADSSFAPPGNILKYRSQHLFRFDAEVQRNAWFLGLSARYQSTLQNIDLAWLAFERSGLIEPWGLEQWLADNPQQPCVVDLRAGINLNEQHKVSLVVSNLTNAEYSVRPLAIESPRLVNVVYTYEVH